MCVMHIMSSFYMSKVYLTDGFKQVVVCSHC